MRGRLGAVFQITLTFGILVASVIGYGFTVAPVDATYIWRLQFGVGAVFSIALGVLALIRLPEAPKKTNEIDDKEPKGGYRELFCHKSSVKYIFIAIVLASSCQLTGINGIFYYGPTIIAAAGFNNRYLLNISFGAVNFLACFGALGLVDKWGRRPLLITAMAVNTASLLLVAIAFLVLNGLGLAIAVGIGLLLFITAFEFGIGCLFWIIINELYPRPILRPSAVFSNVLNWSFNIVLSMTFPALTTAVGTAGSFFIFSGVSLGCTIFLGIFIKETKAK
jgi:MFS family permease